MRAALSLTQLGLETRQHGIPQALERHHLAPHGARLGLGGRLGDLGSRGVGDHAPTQHEAPVHRHPFVDELRPG